MIALIKIFRKLSFFLLLSLFLLTGCRDKTEIVKEQLTGYSNTFKVINTHEHQLDPARFGYPEFNYFSLLKNSYLEFDVISSGGVTMSDSLLKNTTVEKLVDIYADHLRYSSNTSHAQQFFRGISESYNTEFSGFNKDQIIKVSEEIKKNYLNYPRWFDQNFHKAGFELMMIDQFWPYTFDVDTSYFRLVFNTNQIAYGVTSVKENGENLLYFTDFLKTKGTDFRIKSLDDYLLYIDYMFAKAKEKNALCLKNSMAYSRSIDFEEISHEDADILFDKSPGLSQSEKKSLEDFMIHQIIRKSVEYDLPVQIHAGYLAGNGNLLENSDPMKLNKLFLKYPRARFVIFHGGYPWTGEVISLVKMFPNVYLDLVWLPQISVSRACIAFDEILDCVPYNKIMWGGDCRFIEESVGSLNFGKEVVIEVLSRRVAGKQMSLEMAKEILKKIFRENAAELFKI